MTVRRQMNTKKTRTPTPDDVRLPGTPAEPEPQAGMPVIPR